MTLQAPRATTMLGVALLLALSLDCKPALAGAADDAERQQLAQERAAIEASFAARQEDCLRRFVVSSCVATAKSDRRHGLDALRARQIRLDEARRRERSAERRAQLAAAAEAARHEHEHDGAGRGAGAASAAEAAGRGDGPAVARPRSALAIPSASPRRSASAEAASGAKSGSGPVAQRQGKEARSRASFESRKQRAAGHREEVLDATIKRMGERAAATPLPVPDGPKKP